jgi:NTP pyrophosphatase (non-canonical NTP hydrolase)
LNIKEIQETLRKFAEERDWEQFHSPKNLSMALAGEAAELMEIFQWLTEEQSRNVTSSEEDIALIRREMADIFIYLARLADKLDVDIEEAVGEKVRLNEEKYPVSLSKGSATKYSRR